MVRVNLLAAPHKGLRNILGKFSFCLGYTNFADPTQLKHLKQVGHELFTLLRDHVHTENDYMLPRLDERLHGASTHDRADHERLEAVQESLQQQLSGFTGQESAEAIHRFYLNVSRFQSQYLEHIFDEETVTEVLLQQHFTDQELMQQRNLTLQRIKFPILLLWLKYIIPAQGEPESVGLLSGLRATVSTDAFAQIMTTLQGVMEVERYEALRANVDQAANALPADTAPVTR